MLFSQSFTETAALAVAGCLIAVPLILYLISKKPGFEIRLDLLKWKVHPEMSILSSFTLMSFQICMTFKITLWKMLGSMSSNVLPQKNESFGMKWHLTGYNFILHHFISLVSFTKYVHKHQFLCLYLMNYFWIHTLHKHLSCLGYNLSNDLLADISFWQLFFSWHIVFMCCQGTQVCCLKSPAVSAQASVFLIREKPPTVTVCHSPQELQQGVQEKHSPRHAPLLQTGIWTLCLS